MGIKLGLVGLGSFGKAFAPLFIGHPQVDSVGLCDAEADRMQDILNSPEMAKKVDRKCVTTSFDEICKSDCDALVIITQPWLHAPQCIQAMESGKDVYSAVPVICLPDDMEMLDWCAKIIDTVKSTGKQYMLGETTIYRPQTMFCARKAAAGEFGEFVYAEAEYAHDLDSECSLRQVQERRQAGKIGAQHDALMKPYFDRGCLSHPMSYPTHSVSGVVEVMRAKPLTVSAIGYRNRNNDPYFKTYDFSDISALFRLENGAAFRVCEMREISANIGLQGEDFRIFGTSGSYSCNEWRCNGRTAPTPEIKLNKAVHVTDEEMRDPLPREVLEAFHQMLHPGEAPKTDFVPSGHGGSHPYLVHEFISAVCEHRVPRISAWDAAMYMAMGVAAHQSAQKDGEIVKVVDFGKTWK